MALTPPEPVQFLPKNFVYPTQLDNALDAYAWNEATAALQKVDPSAMGERMDAVEKESKYSKFQIIGLRKYWEKYWSEYWNKSVTAIETEVGFERLSNPKRNILINGGFTNWNAAGTLPDGWTATNSPTISQVTGRAGIGSDHVGLRIASGGSAGSIARTLNIRPSTIYACAGWVQVASGATATITLTTNGTAVTSTLAIPASLVGASAWFGFPRIGYELKIQTPSNATTMSVTLQGTANLNVDFCDFQIGDGTNRDADLWIPAVEDTTSLTNVTTFGSHWATPSAIAADQNDYAPGTTSRYRISTSGSVQTITGMSLSQTAGMDLWLRNVGNVSIVLAHQSASSTAANRFLNFSNQDVVLAAESIAHYIYDDTKARWIGDY